MESFQALSCNYISWLRKGCWVEERLEGGSDSGAFSQLETFNRMHQCTSVSTFVPNIVLDFISMHILSMWLSLTS